MLWMKCSRSPMLKLNNSPEDSVDDIGLYAWMKNELFNPNCWRNRE